jgi:hypothetical protein
VKTSAREVGSTAPPGSHDAAIAEGTEVRYGGRSTWLRSRPYHGAWAVSIASVLAEASTSWRSARSEWATRSDGGTVATVPSSSSSRA